MKLPCLFSLVVAAALSIVGCAPLVPRDATKTASEYRPAQIADLAITKVQIIDTVTGTIRPEDTILVKDGRVQSLERPDGTYAARAVKDGAGAYVLPGLWDAHVHIIQDAAQDGNDVQSIIEAYLSRGVLQVRDMGSSTADFQAFQSFRKSSEQPLPFMLSSERKFRDTELPYGDKSTFDTVTTYAQARKAASRQKEAGVDFLKLYGPISAEMVMALGKVSRELEMPIAGHYPQQVTLDDMIALAPVSIEHLSFALDDCALESGSSYFNRAIGARFRNSDLNQHQVFLDFLKGIDWTACKPQLEALAQAGTAFTPTLGVSLGYGSALDSAILDSFPAESQCRREADAFTPQIERKLRAEVTRAITAFREAGITLLAGADAPVFCVRHGASLLEELILLSQVGLTPLEAIQSATIEPSRVFGLGDEFGRVEPGYQANLVFYPHSPLEDLSRLKVISAVMVEGEYLELSQ